MTSYWRLSWLGPDGWLYPPFGYDSNTAIRPSARAVCTKNRTHRPPEPDCHCGYYATDNLPALLPLAIALRDMNDQAAAARCTPVLHGVELGNAVRQEHEAHTNPFGALRLVTLRMQGINPVVEGRGTWRGSPLTVTGPLHIPAHPGTTGTVVDTTSRRYGTPATRHPGDIVDVVEKLISDEQANEQQQPAGMAAEEATP